jgi:hypothetical protein
VIVLYEFDKIWRVIWTDGRELDKDPPEPRWFGYSVGKWEDDYTFVVTTNGTDERTWLDKAGRPHSADLVMEERFQRVSRDRLELTLTINDPKMYTKPWKALDKFPFKLLPPTTDVREMMCSVSEFRAYDQAMKFNNPADKHSFDRSPGPCREVSDRRSNRIELRPPFGLRDADDPALTRAFVRIQVETWSMSPVISRWCFILTRVGRRSRLRFLNEQARRRVRSLGSPDS